MEEEETETQLNWKRPRMSGKGNGSSSSHSYNYKTQLCRRFRQGTCSVGSKCTYAHGLAELRRQQGGVIHQEPKVCRMFSQYKRCSYGHSCRFLHTQTQTQQFNNAPFDVKLLNPTTKASHFSHAHAHAQGLGQPQPGGGKHSGGYSSAEYRVMQTSTAATNVSTSTVATSSFQKNEQPYSVKCIFKENELQKISRIYADWI